MVARKPELAAPLLAARGAGPRARALVSALRACHRNARGAAAGFELLGLRAARAASPAALRRLTEATGVALPATLAAIYRIHGGLVWRWAARERGGEDGPSGGLELLSPAEALRRARGDARLAGCLPFARIEPAGDLWVLRSPRGGGEPFVAMFVHDEEGAPRRVAASFDAWLDRSLEQGFVEPFRLAAATRRALAPVLRCFAGERDASPVSKDRAAKPRGVVRAAPQPADPRRRLFEALRAGRAAEVQAILAGGWTEGARDGEILLCVAAGAGHEALGLWLMQRRSPDVAWRIGGTASTLLHEAARGGSVRLVGALLDAGAVVDARDSFGATPLHLAATIDVARALLAAGASPKRRDKNGESPAEVQRRLGRRDIARVLAAAE